MQKASSHRLHSTDVELVDSRRLIVERLLDHRVILGAINYQLSGYQLLHSAIGRMEPAPTHCRHMVSGTISLR